MFFKERRLKYKSAYALNTQHFLHFSQLYRNYSLVMEIWFKVLEIHWSTWVRTLGRDNSGSHPKTAGGGNAPFVGRVRHEAEEEEQWAGPAWCQQPGRWRLRSRRGDAVCRLRSLRRSGGTSRWVRGEDGGWRARKQVLMNCYSLPVKVQLLPVSQATGSAMAEVVK